MGLSQAAEPVEPVQPVEMKIYQSNTFRKYFSWLLFDDEPWVQARQQLKNQQSYIPVSNVYLIFPSSS